MLSKNQLKFIRGLKKKKIRQTQQLFLAEGIKVVEELINSSFVIRQIYALESYSNPYNVSEIQVISEKELQLISDFSSPNRTVCIFEIPKPKELNKQGITVVLDEINDPGNLGTIIRLCDWFDVSQLVCSENTVDCFNQKVVQASMGSLTRVSINYVDLGKYLANETRTIYGTFLKGENIYTSEIEENAVIVLGNEANGISNHIEKLIRKKITIPQFGDQQHTESLNVAMATAIILSEFKR